MLPLASILYCMGTVEIQGRVSVDGLSSFQGSLTDTLPIKPGDLLNPFPTAHHWPWTTEQTQLPQVTEPDWIEEIDCLSLSLKQTFFYHSEGFPLNPFHPFLTKLIIFLSPNSKPNSHTKHFHFWILNKTLFSMFIKQVCLCWARKNRHYPS